MKMPYEKLLSEGFIRKFQAEPEQIRHQLDVAARDLKTAVSNLESESYDWSYAIAYNAMLQAARALMFSRGHRPRSGEGQHKTVIRFAEETIGLKFEDEILFFDKMRSKRNRLVYEISGIVSESEGKQAIGIAEKFVGIIKEELETNS